MISLLDTILAIYHSIGFNSHRWRRMTFNQFNELRESIVEVANEAMINSNIETARTKINIYDFDLTNWYNIASLEKLMLPPDLTKSLKRTKLVVLSLLNSMASRNLEIDKVVCIVAQKLYSKHFFNINTVIVVDKLELIGEALDNDGIQNEEMRVRKNGGQIDKELYQTYSCVIQCNVW